MKKTLLIFATLCTTLILHAEVLLIEDFDYNIGETLANHGWFDVFGNTNNISVTNSIDFEDYAGCNIGNAALLDTKESQPLNKVFKPVTSGNVYVAFTLYPYSVSELNTFCVALRGEPTTSNFDMCGRVWLNNQNQIGLTFSKNSGDNRKYLDKPLNPTTNYLVVVKYSINAGDKNDATSLFVFDKFPTSEPSTPTIGPLSDSNYNDITPQCIVLRSSDDNNHLVIDGIRIATTWEEAVAAGTCQNNTKLNTISQPNLAYTTNGILHLNLPQNTTVTIYDTTGKCVANKQMTAGSHQLNLQKGFYMLRIGTEMRKIIIS